ncbi:MAG: inorganic phosphate transporter [Saprospiraceae bacterium]|nr:inorganic phosphate transporter [Saprospiraceae bacterium]
METFLIIGLIILVILAFSDLVVGVGNDAVNFLNSAIGSKIASFKTIMWVATAGIFIGALSSAGMMEIAREGIFNPEYFSLQDVMIIFLAVMLSDIFLLDAFNTMGMPTSTTVSIIFELLGASVMVAAYKILVGNYPMNWLFNLNDPENGVTGLLNWSKTNTIISGIFLSILIAFVFGTLVMYLSRLLFSFNYKNKLRFTGVIWASFAMLTMCYFIVFKGLKSTYSFEKLHATELQAYIKAVNPNASDLLPDGDIVRITDLKGRVLEFKKIQKSESGSDAIYEVFFGNLKIKQAADYFQKNLYLSLFILLGFWLILLSILERRGINPLKVVVFGGTFSLAMAFAGNDLVNFIGVPLAGLQSYDLFQTANSAVGGTLNPDKYMMVGLKFPIQMPHIYLLIAGLVMVLTLWFSKKARSVTETEVKLGSQEETEENFKSNLLSRLIVRGSIAMSLKLGNLIPLSIQNHVNKRFTSENNDYNPDPPAFDLVRASVNMTMAGMLIAIGTNLKLPLSTTYVTFMVAMGTSLADRAWGRESASYRIAGVINVIGGWFITAFVAFGTAAIIAALLLNFKLAGLIVMVVVLISFILYTGFVHRMKLKKQKQSNEALQSIDLTTDRALQKTAIKLSDSLLRISQAYHLAIHGLLDEDLTKLNEAKKVNSELTGFYSDIKNNLYKAIKKSKLNEKHTAQLYILSNDMMQDILQSLKFILDAADNHVKNAHKPLTNSQKDNILQIESEVLNYLGFVSGSLHSHEYDELGSIKSNKRTIFDHIETSLSYQVEGISKKEYGFKNTDIVLSILLETKDLVAIAVRFSKLLHRITKGESPLGNR